MTQPNAQRHVDPRPTWRCVRLAVATTRLLARNNRVEVGLASFSERFNVRPGSVRVDPHEVRKAGEVAGVPSVLLLGATCPQQVRHANDANRVPVALVVDKVGGAVFCE